MGRVNLSDMNPYLAEIEISVYLALFLPYLDMGDGRISWLTVGD
jgi:hypothetical protein